MLVDERTSYRQLAIVEKYERFIDYLYPILQNCPRKHGVIRDTVLAAMFAQVDLFITAGKSKQVSRLYSADANLALLRFYLRFLVRQKPHIIAPNQHKVALGLLGEVGKMTGAWIGSGNRGG